MALSQGSVITISDINAEFDTKIDSAGTGLSKSGTSLSLASLHSASGSAGPTANATPAYGATFTVPQINYDTYGRVTGHTNMTVTIPAASSGYPTVQIISTTGTSYTLPSGGQWAYYVGTYYKKSAGSGDSDSYYWYFDAGSKAGGSNLSLISYSSWPRYGLAIRTA